MYRLKSLFIMFFCCWIVISGCGKRVSEELLSEPSRMYFKEGHLPSRALLSFLPQDDAIAVVAPSVDIFLTNLFSINKKLDGRILSVITRDTTLQKFFTDDIQGTKNNLQQYGIDINRPLGGFYTLDEKWAVILPSNSSEALIRAFPQAQKTTLRTSWTWFITRRDKAFWDPSENMGFMYNKGFVFLSNDLSLLTKMKQRESEIPPRFYYGLTGSPVVSTNEMAILVSLSDEMEQIIAKKKEKPKWVEGVLSTLKSRFVEIGLFVESNEEKVQLYLGGFKKNKGKHEIQQTSTLVSFITPGHSALATIPITDSLLKFFSELQQNDKTGNAKKGLGQALGAFNSGLISDEICFALYNNPNTKLDGILITKSKQTPTLLSLLQMVAKKEETTIEDFQILNTDLKIIKLPIEMKIGIKDPYIVIVTDPNRLTPTIQQINTGGKSDNIPSDHSECPFGFFTANNEGLKAILENNQDLFKTEKSQSFTELLTHIEEICAFENEEWNMIRIKFSG